MAEREGTALLELVPSHAPLTSQHGSVHQQAVSTPCTCTCAANPHLAARAPRACSRTAAHPRNVQASAETPPSTLRCPRSAPRRCSPPSPRCSRRSRSASACTGSRRRCCRWLRPAMPPARVPWCARPAPARTHRTGTRRGGGRSAAWPSPPASLPLACRPPVTGRRRPRRVRGNWSLQSQPKTCHRQLEHAHTHATACLVALPVALTLVGRDVHVSRVRGWRRCDGRGFWPPMRVT